MVDDADRPRSPVKQNRIEGRQWLEQVALDRNLPASALKIAMLIEAHINRARPPWMFWAWPSQETLAALTGKSKRAVQDQIGALIERHHLVERQRGQRSNAYQPVLWPQRKSITEASKAISDARKSAPLTNLTDRKKSSPLPLNPIGSFQHPDRNFSADRGEDFRDQRRKNLPPNLGREPSFEPSTEIEPEWIRESQIGIVAAVAGAPQARPADGMSDIDDPYDYPDDSEGNDEGPEPREARA